MVDIIHLWHVREVDKKIYSPENNCNIILGAHYYKKFHKGIKGKGKCFVFIQIMLNQKLCEHYSPEQDC